MRIVLWCFHDFGQHALHIAGVDEENQRAVRADPGFAQHALAHGLKLGLGGVDIGHFVAHMMLPAGRVLLKEAGDRGVAGQRLDQLDLRAVQRTIRAGSVDKADLHALIGQIKRRVDLGRAHNVAVKHDGVRDGRRCHANVVEAT